MDLDKPSHLDRFVDCCRKIEEQLIKEGVVLNFSTNNLQEDYKILERKRCFFMDAVKKKIMWMFLFTHFQKVIHHIAEVNIIKL